MREAREEAERTYREAKMQVEKAMKAKREAD